MVLTVMWIHSCRFVLVVPLLLAACPCVAGGPLHAQCRVEWTFGIPCNNVYLELVSQIKEWKTADNCANGGEKCLYTLKSANEHYIVAKHTTPVHKYVDNLTFKLTSSLSKRSCYVSGFSVSELWYSVLDHGTNYCNLHNLIEGSGLDKVSGYSESTNNFKCTQYSSANCTIY
ncbi:uncharacterized protein LOC127570767 isoform X1 [Pristis pectinata]|uniref:uncharacterized protein LOC127570767 isoform X1 n=1 Tax=Pristis pectinata TaxID=685728 RepID=UPI00223CA84D|nr:uncharacterized protein LOC127570767 isoform X1 [Pristis pectinata]